MTFNIALSGLSAASKDLQITGNNIANASTVGFKASRAEFADVYASSLMGSGGNQVGGGVKLANIAQQFGQGTISFTNNSLDLALDGNGFFVLSDGGSRSFTRSGSFGVDEDGFIVANSGGRVQGFTANDQGTLSGVVDDLRINTSRLPPVQTTLVEASVNLDAREPVLSQLGSSISTLGSAVGVARSAQPDATPTTLPAAGAPVAFDFTADAASFDVTIAGSSGSNGTVTVTLDQNVGDATDLIAAIRPDLLASGLPLDVREDPNAPGQIEFFSTISGEPSAITVGNLVPGADPTALANVLQLGGASLPGVAAGANGYAAQTVDVVQADGSAQTVAVAANATAAAIASQFSSTGVPGVSASATTEARLPAGSFDNTSGTLELSVNGIAVSGATLAEIAGSINGASGLGTVSAAIDDNGDLVVTDLIGNDLVFGLAGGGTDSVDVIGPQGSAISLGTSGTSVVSVGGTVEFALAQGVLLADASPAVTNLFGSLGASQFTEFELNTFDPSDQETYNSATSLTIFDSLGNPHVMSLYFVKERHEEGAPDSQRNSWAVYAQIDGRDVGDPDPNLPPPQNAEPTRARFEMLFNTDGSMNPAGSDSILISNWTPLDANGEPNGASGPQNMLAGGSLPIAVPPGSSNFELRLTDSTQTGSVFSADRLAQNGSTTGELSGLAIDDEGIVSARFTNGENQVLGQIAVADFENVQGLAAAGDTAWIETNASGGPMISAPGAGTNGSVVSGALEASNVDLSEQLVQLIIAQRNFQANARTISTADEINQTIINL